jgi:colanic acid biosynthesis protein WcaH
MLDDKKFLEIIDSTPLVSIDLILEDDNGDVLLGKRVNRPAQGYWFVPGGRIMKNEKLADAMKRISTIELGFTVNISDAHLLGSFDHIYDDNRFAADRINTHYVVLAYKLNACDKLAVRPDYQHSEIKWWPKSELLISPEVHQNTKHYFIDT